MHLVVLHHGVWGTPRNTQYLENLFTEHIGNTGFVLNFSGNFKCATCDGIDACGERLFQGVKSAHDNLVHQGTPPTHISFVGYSIGGLIARYAAGRLFSEGYFDHVTPLNFVTIATPHLGSWRQPLSTMIRLMNRASSTALSRTGTQLYLNDTTPWGAPLLCVISHPGLNFMGALRSFKNIVTMANVRHDRTVTFCSAAMQLDDPYPTRGFECAVAPVDPTYPSIVRPRKPGEEPANPSPAHRPQHGRFLLALQVLLAVILFPLTLLILLVLLIYGRLHSRRKAIAADQILQEVYMSCGAGGAMITTDKQRTPSQGPEPPLLRSSSVDLESALMTRATGNSSDGGYGPKVPIISISVAACSGGASFKSGLQDRVPLQKDHLRHLFAGLPAVTSKRAVQEWLEAQLDVLPVRKVHVDTCNVLNAHLAIIVGSRRFLHCQDAMQYLVDRCLVGS